jgi:hypothetical protein
MFERMCECFVHAGMHMHGSSVCRPEQTLVLVVCCYACEVQELAACYLMRY